MNASNIKTKLKNGKYSTLSKDDKLDYYTDNIVRIVQYVYLSKDGGAAVIKDNMYSEAFDDINVIVKTYIDYLAADEALTYVASKHGYSVDFDATYAVIKAYYETYYLSGFTADEVTAAADAYAALNAVVPTVTASGKVDDYLAVCANIKALENLGINAETDSKKGGKDYTDATKDLKNTSSSAIRDTAALHGTTFVEIATIYFTAKAYYEDAITAYAIVEEAELNKGKVDSNVMNEALDKFNVVKTEYEAFKAIYEALDAMVADRIDEIKEIVKVTGSNDDFVAGVDAAIKNYSPEEEDDDDNKNDESDAAVSKYSTKNIVAVTYGNKDGSAYKTILLNYNNYSVCVEYNGTEYIIPAYEFVVANN